MEVYKEKNSYNLYVNDGSIRPTDLLSNEIIQPSEWKNGTVLNIRICDAEVEIITRSVRDGKSHARGYYRVKKGDIKRQEEIMKRDCGGQYKNVLNRIYTVISGSLFYQKNIDYEVYAMIFSII